MGKHPDHGWEDDSVFGNSKYSRDVWAEPNEIDQIIAWRKEGLDPNDPPRRDKKDVRDRRYESRWRNPSPARRQTTYSAPAGERHAYDAREAAHEAKHGYPRTNREPVETYRRRSPSGARSRREPEPLTTKTTYDVYNKRTTTYPVRDDTRVASEQPKTRDCAAMPSPKKAPKGPKEGMGTTTKTKRRQSTGGGRGGCIIL